MKVKKGFQLRDVCGEHVVVAHGLENIDFSRIIHLNESAALVWKAISQSEFTTEDMAQALMAEYDVTADTALSDATQLAEQWKEIGLIE